MKCARCGAGMPEGVTLIRVNPKGEKGIFICQENCGAVNDDPELQDLISVLKGEASGVQRFEFTDRYKALGIPYPDPKMICAGQCEGIGMYPQRLDDPSITDYEQQAWIDAHNRLDAHKSEPCDGWHFIRCAECGGTGKRQKQTAPTSGPDKQEVE